MTCLQVVSDDNNLTVIVKAQQSVAKLVFWCVFSNNVLAHHTFTYLRL